MAWRRPVRGVGGRRVLHGAVCAALFLLATHAAATASASLLFPEVRADAHGAPEPRLVASGCSVSNIGYLSDLAAAYEARTGTRMFVRGGGSAVGLDDLAGGKVDFAASCRGREAHDPAGIEFVQVAWDALVFIVHPSSTVQDITLAEARSIYEGKITDWGGLRAGGRGPIALFFQRPATGLSGVEHCVRAFVLDGDTPTPGPGAVTLASSGLVEQFVEQTAGGFGASGFSSARRREVRMLSLDGVAPTHDTIARRAYPLLRPLYLLVRRPATPAVQAFLDFALGAEGQGIISALGAVSLRDVR